MQEQIQKEGGKGLQSFSHASCLKVGLKVVRGKASLKRCQLYEQLKECLRCSAEDACPVWPGLSGLLSLAPMEPTWGQWRTAVIAVGPQYRDSCTCLCHKCVLTSLILAICDSRCFPMLPNFRLQASPVLVMHFTGPTQTWASKSAALDAPAGMLEVPSPIPITSPHMPDRPAARPGRGAACSLSGNMDISAALTKSNRRLMLNFPFPVPSASPSLSSRDISVPEPVQPQLFACPSKVLKSIRPCFTPFKESWRSVPQEEALSHASFHFMQPWEAGEAARFGVSALEQGLQVLFSSDWKKDFQFHKSWNLMHCRGIVSAQVQIGPIGFFC